MGIWKQIRLKTLQYIVINFFDGVPICAGTEGAALTGLKGYPDVPVWSLFVLRYLNNPDILIVEGNLIGTGTVDSFEFISLFVYIVEELLLRI